MNTKPPTPLEKSFINWTIAVLKSKRLDFEKMISDLKLSNPPLGEWAEAKVDKIHAPMVNFYAKTFQNDITEACMAAEDPQKAAKEFFKQIGATATKEFQTAVKKQLKEKWNGSK